MHDIEKAIKGLEQFKSDYKPFCGNRADWERVDNALAVLKEQKAIKPNEWIKCSDEMPEEHETIFAKFKGSDDVRVVVMFEDGTRRVHHSYTFDGKWECEKSPLKRTVTHWMPNPELPDE